MADIDFEVIARQTSGLTGADLANIANEAAIAAARHRRKRLEQSDFDNALERVVAGMQSRRALTAHERRVIAFHEAGHTLCAELLPGVDRTHKVSIVPRGKALGYTLHFPEEDRYLKTRAELLDQMTGPARRPRRGGDGLRQHHDRRVRRPQAGRGDLALDDPRVGDGHVRQRPAAHRRGRRRLGPHARAARRRAAAPRRRGDAPCRAAADARTAPQLDQLAGALLRQEVLEREDIERIMEGVPTPGRAASGHLRVAAAEPPDRPRGILSGQVLAPVRSTRRMGAADDFRALLEPGAIRAVFQPIVRLSDLGTIGYEGLSRFPTPPGLVALPPDVTLAAAARSGLRDELEVACWRAIAAAGVPPHGRLLWVNLSPEALGHPGLLELAGKLPSRLVIELTEQDTVLNHALLRERLRPWIARGALVAVDDAGAGFTSLEYVADIRPDFLKLSRGMVAGVDRDSTREDVLRATAAFAREVGARIVAEGVERPEELATLRAMDIDYGQGWLFGRPGEAWPRDTPAARLPIVRAAVSGRLERDLERACTARDASEAVVEHLARRGLLPGVFLAQGGRLRYQAARGFWQVYDGLPASAGIVGRVFRTGVAAVLDDVGEAPDYLPSVPGDPCRGLPPARRRRPGRRRARRRVR